MKNIYRERIFFNPVKRVYLLFLYSGFLCLSGFSQTSYTFTTAGATGQNGPNQTQVNAAYLNTNLSGSVTVLGTGVQQWTVPVTGAYRVKAIGASGGAVYVNCFAFGGLGADMSGEFNLTAGQVLLILVGQGGITNGSDGGGGGGSYVTSSASVAMVVAGGGGGATINLGFCGANLNGVNASITTTGTAAASQSGFGGIGGNGSGQGNPGGSSGGGGFFTNGFGGSLGFPLAFMNGASGATGQNADHGGYGGGSQGWYYGGIGPNGGGGGNGGAGGGYSGGAAFGGFPYPGGGGGGSYNTGTNQFNGLTVGPGDGRVIITLLCNITLNTPVNPICLGNSATITTNGISNYAWSNGLTTSSIVVSPSVTTSYTLSATSLASCTGSSAITITVNTSPVVSAVSSSSAICSGKTITLTATGATTYTWTGGVTNGVSFLPVSTSIYTVTGGNACGTSSAVVSVSVAPTPSLTLSINHPTICTGSSVILNSTGATSYTWSPGVFNNVAFTPAVTTNYTLTAAGAAGCTATAVMGVTVVPIPTIIPFASPGLICSGSSATLSATGITNYTWQPTGTFTGANSASVAVTPVVTTNYSVTGSGASGCVSQTVITVTVIPGIPVLSITAVPGNSICPGKPVTLTASGASTYTWTTGIINGVSYLPSAPGVYTVTGSNVCGASTATTSITFNPVPNITASINNPTICSGNPVIFNGGGGVSYTWTPSAPNNAIFFPTTTQNYTVTGTNTLGCTASAVQGVTVLNTPTLAPVATPTAMCFGSTATLSAGSATGFTWTPGTNPNTPSITVAPPVTTTYTLFRVNGLCSGNSTVNLVVDPYPLINASATPSQVCAGDGVNIIISGALTNTTYPAGFTSPNFTVYPNSSVNYTVVSSNANCTASLVLPVVVDPGPVISITSSTNAICQGQNVTLTANVPVGLSYTWQPMNTNNITVTASPLATSVIGLSAANSLGCITTQNQVIIVNPLPNMSLASGAPFICAAQAAVLLVANPSSNAVYNWNSGPPGLSIQVSPTVTTSYIATGINTITGCQNSNTITLAVFISTFVVSSPTALCLGSTATLTATGPATSYSWTTNGGTPIVIGAPSVTVAPLVNTSYYVTGSNGGCNNTQSVNIAVNPLPNVTASTVKSTICRFEVSTVMGNGATSYSWNTGASTATISPTLSTTTTYTLTGTDNNGCANTVTVTQFVATCIGLEDLSSEDNGFLNIYPNPNNGNFTLSSDMDTTLNIVNALGQVVGTIILAEDDKKKEVTVSRLPDGIYFITGEANGLKLNKKIIIER